jgi:hypothetical protein
VGGLPDLLLDSCSMPRHTAWASAEFEVRQSPSQDGDFRTASGLSLDAMVTRRMLLSFPRLGKNR